MMGSPSLVSNSGFGGFSVQRHLDHCLPKTQLREQALRAIIVRFAPEDNLGFSPRVSPRDRLAEKALCDTLTPRALVDVNVVD
ncbi:MAG TPA: hypothetical protein VK527_11620, partial [Candidatus Limnocylindrales bacterium]|nr:hypothetical protein [Candidatus Limnocylindrales bacterium]